MAFTRRNSGLYTHEPIFELLSSSLPSSLCEKTNRNETGNDYYDLYGSSYSQHPFSSPSVSPKPIQPVTPQNPMLRPRNVTMKRHSGYYGQPSLFKPALSNSSYERTPHKTPGFYPGYTAIGPTSNPSLASPLGVYHYEVDDYHFGEELPGLQCTQHFHVKSDPESMPPTPVESTPPIITVASPGPNFLVFDFDDFDVQDFSLSHPYAHPLHIESHESTPLSFDWDLIEELEEIAERVKQLDIPTLPDSCRFGRVGVRSDDIRMGHDASSNSINSSDQPSLWTDSPRSKLRLRLRKRRSSH